MTVRRDYVRVDSKAKQSAINDRSDLSRRVAPQPPNATKTGAVTTITHPVHPNHRKQRERLVYLVLPKLRGDIERYVASMIASGVSMAGRFTRSDVFGRLATTCDLLSK